ncbi:MAG: small subunit ribosomal protein S16 [Candidatus Peregrinibacteria bacterium Greene0416_19]|nr:MAG: small subunit ribosomal protein S16 [Candidatus Peregrinibacteria bacterium Greene0416_19]
MKITLHTFFAIRTLFRQLRIMLVIRLQRTGRENDPTYRLVVAEKARPVKGKHLEVVGHYLPARKGEGFVHKDERIAYWIGQGAIPSDTVARLLRKAGLQNMDKFILRYTKRKSKKEQQAEAAASAAPAPSAPAEAPAA